jgi:hypothetical protein
MLFRNIGSSNEKGTIPIYELRFLFPLKNSGTENSSSTNPTR